MKGPPAMHLVGPEFSARRLHLAQPTSNLVFDRSGHELEQQHRLPRCVLPARGFLAPSYALSPDHSEVAGTWADRMVRGRVILKTVPSRPVLSMLTWPPCSWTIFCTTASPRPMPFSFP